MNWLFLAIGLILIVLGLALRRRTEGGYFIQIGQRAWSIFGDVTQSHHGSMNIAPAGQGSTQRDWVGWTISGIGTLIAISQVLRFVG